MAERAGSAADPGAGTDSRIRTGGTAPRWAGFTVDAGSTRLGGAEGLSDLLGLAVGEVVLTQAVLQAHLHPEDRVRWQDALERCLTGGLPTVVSHRFRRAQGDERVATTTFVSTGSGGVHTVLADLTDGVRSTVASQVSVAVQRAAETREVIDQAKGMIMAILDLDADQAFALLRWHSSHTNTKLREISELVVERMTTAETTMPPRQRLAAVFTALGAAPAPGAGWTRTEAVTAPTPPVANTIPSALLPGILTRAVNDASVSISVADMMVPDRPLVYVNPAFEKLTGYSAAEILGRNCRFLQGDHANAVENAGIREAMASGLPVDTLIRNFRRDGSAFWNEFHLSPVVNTRGRLTHYIGYQLDVTERVEREEQLHRLVYQDAPTGLPNRAAAARHLDLLQAAETGFDLIAVRSDQFGDQDVLDDSNDRVLTLLAAQRLLGLVPEAFLARADTDTLLLIGVLPAVEEVLAALQEPLDAHGHTVALQVSAAAVRSATGTPGDLVDFAVQAARAASTSTP